MSELYEIEESNQTVMSVVFTKEDRLINDKTAIRMIESIYYNKIDSFTDLLKEKGTNVVKRKAINILNEYKRLSDLDKINVISIAKEVIRNALKVEPYEIDVAPYKQSLVEMLKPYESSELYKFILEKSEALVWTYTDKKYILDWIEEIAAYQKKKGAYMMLVNLNIKFMWHTTPND